MIHGMKLTALFVGYGLVGMGGEYAVAVRDHISGSGSCDFTVERRVALSASAVRWLRLKAGSGELTVEGREGLERVEAVGVACASDEAYLADLQLTLDRDGDDLVLSAHYPDRSGKNGWRGNDYARIDLTVQVPLDMAVDVEDSSGSMEVRGTGALRIADSSGDIVVERAAGGVTIDDSSGGITLRGVRGDVEIEDGSGDINLSDVTGSVKLRDGSGSVEVEQVTRDVVVERDGSGSISVRDVGGDFTVHADGSGSIRHSGVQGAVDVPAKKGDRRRGS